MDTGNVTIEKARHVGEKPNDKERLILVQFWFYKDKINIVRNSQKLKRTKIFISFPGENANL